MASHSQPLILMLWGTPLPPLPLSLSLFLLPFSLAPHLFSNKWCVKRNTKRDLLGLVMPIKKLPFPTLFRSTCLVCLALFWFISTRFLNETFFHMTFLLPLSCKYLCFESLPSTQMSVHAYHNVLCTPSHYFLDSHFKYLVHRDGRKRHIVFTLQSSYSGNMKLYELKQSHAFNQYGDDII